MSALALLAARAVDVFEVRLRGRELALSLMENQAVQAELERSNERLASFAGQVSHDLKTPLTTLSLSLSLIREQLQDGQVVAESAPLLDRAINVSARMADLIDDVLDYARLGGTLRATEVDLDFVLGKVLEDLAPSLPTSRCTSASCPRCWATAPSSLPCCRTCSGTPPGTAPTSARSRCTSPPGTCSARGGSRSPTTAAAYRPPNGTGSSSRSPVSTTRSRAPASGWPPAAGSSALTAAGSASTPR